MNLNCPNMPMTKLSLRSLTRNLQQMYSNFCQTFKNILAWKYSRTSIKRPLSGTRQLVA